MRAHVVAQAIAYRTPGNELQVSGETAAFHDLRRHIEREQPAHLVCLQCDGIADRLADGVDAADAGPG